MVDLVQGEIVGAANESHVKNVEEDLEIYKGLWSLYLRG